MMYSKRYLRARAGLAGQRPHRVWSLPEGDGAGDDEALHLVQDPVAPEHHLLGKS